MTVVVYGAAAGKVEVEQGAGLVVYGAVAGTITNRGRAGVQGIKWGLPLRVEGDELAVEQARTGSCSRKSTCGVMFQPRRLRTRSGPSVVATGFQAPTHPFDDRRAEHRGARSYQCSLLSGGP